MQSNHAPASLEGSQDVTMVWWYSCSLQQLSTQREKTYVSRIKEHVCDQAYEAEQVTAHQQQCSYCVSTVNLQLTKDPMC